MNKMNGINEIKIPSIFEQDVIYLMEEYCTYSYELGFMDQDSAIYDYRMVSTDRFGLIYAFWFTHHQYSQLFDTDLKDEIKMTEDQYLYYVIEDNVNHFYLVDRGQSRKFDEYIINKYDGVLPMDSQIERIHDQIEDNRVTINFKYIYNDYRLVFSIDNDRSYVDYNCKGLDDFDLYDLNQAINKEDLEIEEV